MMVLKSCKGDTCIDPWRVLHPRGDVSNILDAVKSEFDDFYLQQPKVSFSECRVGYFPEVEGPMQANSFEEGGSRWSDELKRNAGLDEVHRGPWHVWT